MAAGPVQFGASTIGSVSQSSGSTPGSTCSISKHGRTPAAMTSSDNGSSGWPGSPQYSSAGSQSPIGCNARAGATSLATEANRGYTHGVEWSVVTGTSRAAPAQRR